ncbi:MAG: ABC transporter permease [Planctomycetota bacterium]|nr:ABC transporter permease [Planctomycetota bacterium]
MLGSDFAYTSPEHFSKALASPEIRYSILLSLFSCNLTAMLSLVVAVPLGYVMTRVAFPGKAVVDAILDIPVVLPPLVVGLSLLILFRTAPGRLFESTFESLTGMHITYAVPGVILAQFMVAAAFAVRTMRATFDQIPIRHEQVALTLGCSRWQAFRLVVLPQVGRGVLTAATIAWARALGEFGPILIFAGATRHRTEVLSTTVFLELSIGNIESAVAVSVLMVAVAMGVLILIRTLGQGERRPGSISGRGFGA